MLNLMKNLNIEVFFLKQLRKLTQFFYKYPVLVQVAEWMRKIYIPNQKTILIQDFDQNLKFYCQLDDYISSQIFWMGIYSYHQLNFLQNILRRDMVFLDIGANQGEFTFFAAKRLTLGSVIAFEPVNELLNQLEKNIKINSLDNILLVPKGLSNQVSKIPIYKNQELKQYGLRNEGVATLYPQENFTKAEEVELTTLDIFISEHPEIKRIDLIKIDIEGAELFALQGARKTINKFRPIILMEVNIETIKAAGYTPKELLDYMEELGYRYELIFRHSRLARGGQTRPISLEKLSGIDDLVFYPNPTPQK